MIPLQSIDSIQGAVRPELGTVGTVFASGVDD